LQRFPQPGEAKRILEAAEQMPEVSPRGERNLAIMFFLYSSGCRNEELCNLDIEDINLSTRKATVIGKGNSERITRISPETVDALKHYWEIRKIASVKEPAFIRHDKGAGRRRNRLTTASIRNIVNKYAGLAGIEIGKFTPHFFRHNLGIDALEETGNLKMVAELLGHKSTRATEGYAKNRPEAVDKAYDKIRG
jgi:integrase